MKHLMKIWILMAATLTFSSIAVWAQAQGSDGGNLLMENQTHWYQKPADSVGPVDGIATQKGTLLTLQTGSYLYVEGDSTLHQYQINAHALNGSAVIKGPADDLVKALKEGRVGEMSLVVPVDTLHSRESGLDDNAHKALNEKTDPNIRFDLTQESLADGATSGTYVMTATGTLSIAGVSNPVTLVGDTTLKGNQIHIQGVQKVKMSDYKVTPPSISLLVTSITCTDEIEVHYNVIFAAP